MSLDNYNPPNHNDFMMTQLGIQINGKSTFDANNQPKQIGTQFNNYKNNKNKYIEQSAQHYDQDKKKNNSNLQDEDLPKNLKMVSKVISKPGMYQQSTNGSVQKEKRGRKKDTKKPSKKPENAQKKQQVNIEQELGVDQVAQWGQKGAHNNNQYKSDSFDEESEQNNNENNKKTAEQQQIKKRIQEKLKKYQNPGSTKNKNPQNSLQNKVLQLKKQNIQNKQKQQDITIHKKEALVDQSSQELLNKRKAKMEQQVKEHQQSQDPWEKINQKTLAEKKNQAVAIKNAEDVNINKFYEGLDLPQIDDQEHSQEPETGFLQSLCKCLSSRPKPLAHVQKQILKLSKVQLTNKPQQTVMLKSIWTNLANKKYLRYGQHWSQIGFQGRDPATDLRSTGILSLIHWENFIKYDQNYATKIHNFCVQFDIPLALTHIKITSLICSSIKKRLLEGKSWNDFLQWYYAMVYYTFSYILEKGKNIQQIGELIQNSIQRTKNELQNARKYFNKQIKSKR